MEYSVPAPLPPTSLQWLYSTLTGAPPAPQKLGLQGKRIIVISDTHGQHRNLDSAIASVHADILIHAGDFTRHGNLEDAKDFNEWLGSLSRIKHKIVVNGNHEANCEWKSTAASVLSNATFLCNNHLHVEGSVTIYGSQFYWPMRIDPNGGAACNPYFDQIPDNVDILIAHCPPQGHNDYVKGKHGGCPALTKTVLRILPRLVVSGHIHCARGVELRGDGSALQNTVFVNGANMGEGHIVDQPYILLQF